MDNAKLVVLLTHAVKQTKGNYFTSVMVKWSISSLPSMDKITQGEFHFNFFEIPLKYFIPQNT